MATLEERIIARDATIAVLGLGYVGLPLAVEFAESGFTVSGVDLDVQKVATLNAGGSYVADVPAERVAPLVRRGRLRAVTDYTQACRHGDGTRGPDVIFICVPTPYTGAKVPDLSYIEAAARSIAAHLVPEQLVVLESTTYPGTTEELVQPLLERSGLSAARDFYLAFSPERINPGDRHFGVHNTPKVVGGTRPAATRLAKALFEAASPSGVFAVSSPRAAEMTKLLENTFRAVNIALVNELALLAERMGVDIWEVIDAAATKPFGYMRFTPGPGVGGHCIPVDPFYLSWKAREYDFYTRFIEHAAAINESMPFHLYNLVTAPITAPGFAASAPHLDRDAMKPVKIVIIGAGSASLGLNSLATLLREPSLRGSTLALVDINAEGLGLVYRLAERMNGEWDAGLTVASTTDRRAVLDGADFVVCSIEVGPREELWRQDWEVTLRHGVRQPYAENGGPGGVAHAPRKIPPHLRNARDLERPL